MSAARKYSRVKIRSKPLIVFTTDVLSESASTPPLDTVLSTDSHRSLSRKETNERSETRPRRPCSRFLRGQIESRFAGPDRLHRVLMRLHAVKDLRQFRIHSNGLAQVGLGICGQRRPNRGRPQIGGILNLARRAHLAHHG